MPALRAFLAAAPAQKGDVIDAVDTPTLILDFDSFEANVTRLQAWADRHGVAVRAHAKAHKCPAIALYQIKRGAIGICCQKVHEAATFIEAGVRDVLIANQVVGASKLALLVELTRHARMAVCIDDASNLAAIADAMRAGHTTIDVLVEIDVGQGRCGVTSLEAAVRLAQLAHTTPGVSFRGLQAYHGANQHQRSVAARAARCEDVARRIREVIGALRQKGLNVETVSGAGTGSVQFDAPGGVFTELQAGSYAFMDADYGRNEWDDALLFQTSMSLLTTVMSTASASHVVLDAGLKAMSTESGLPVVLDRPDLRVKAVNDEHTIVTTTSANRPPLGDRLRLIVPHVDPAFNLHDNVVVVRDGIVQDVWPISARGPGR